MNYQYEDLVKKETKRYNEYCRVNNISRYSLITTVDLYSGFVGVEILIDNKFYILDNQYKLKEGQWIQSTK